jgi:hypothetical protein
MYPGIFAVVRKRVGKMCMKNINIQCKRKHPLMTGSLKRIVFGKMNIRKRKEKRKRVKSRKSSLGIN